MNRKKLTVAGAGLVIVLGCPIGIVMTSRSLFTAQAWQTHPIAQKPIHPTPIQDAEQAFLAQDTESPIPEHSVLPSLAIGYGLFDTVTLGGWSLQVSQWDRDDDLSFRDGTINDALRGDFVLVFISVTNITHTDAMFSTRLTLVDSQNRTYDEISSSAYVDWLKDWNYSLREDPIAPGETRQAVVGFAVHPVAGGPFVLQWQNIAVNLSHWNRSDRPDAAYRGN